MTLAISSEFEHLTRFWFTAKNYRKCVRNIVGI